MTKEEFEQGYCKCSDITIDEYKHFNVTLPCTCNDDDCEGWAAVSQNEVSIKAHNFLYNHQHETYRG